MRFAAGVRMPRDLDPRMHVGLQAIETAWSLFRLREPTVTHWADGEHMVGSYHKERGRAVDVRTKDAWPDAPQLERGVSLQTLASAVRSRVAGLGFDVILEDIGGVEEHMHVELDKRADDQAPY